MHQHFTSFVVFVMRLDKHFSDRGIRYHYRVLQRYFPNSFPWIVSLYWKKRDLLNVYNDPAASGWSATICRSARHIRQKARSLLEKDLNYTLHKPRRKHFKTLPVMAEGLDHQWVADLVKVQTLSKYNRGYRYPLTVIDVLSKYTWVQPLKDKMDVQLVKAFKKI